jgi:hypothetical protein
MRLPNVPDSTFESVLFDIENFPMTSMRATASRVGVSYHVVTICVRYMVIEGSVVRRRIGQIRGGKGVTYANMISDNFRF